LLRGCHAGLSETARYVPNRPDVYRWVPNGPTVYRFVRVCTDWYKVVLRNAFICMALRFSDSFFRCRGLCAARISNFRFSISHFFGFQRGRAERPSTLPGDVLPLGAQKRRMSVCVSSKPIAMREKKFWIFRGDVVRGLAIPRAQRCRFVGRGYRPAGMDLSIGGAVASPYALITGYAHTGRITGS